jgi:hypothetical protein
MPKLKRSGATPALRETSPVRILLEADMLQFRVRKSDITTKENIIKGTMRTEQYCRREKFEQSRERVMFSSKEKLGSALAWFCNANC